MTLHWGSTAPDCRVVELLAPLILRHFTVSELGDIEYIPTSPYARKARYMGLEVERVIRKHRHQLPTSKYWARTQARLLTSHGMYDIRRKILTFLELRHMGWTCLCGAQKCLYPAMPPLRRPEPAPLPVTSEQDAQFGLELLEMSEDEFQRFLAS